MLATKTRTGWIGIDPGNSLLKTAQLVNERGEWCLRIKTALPRQAVGECSAAENSLPTMAELRMLGSLCPALQGRMAATMLPMSYCELHPLQRVLDEHHESNDIVHDSIASTTKLDADKLEFDYWTVALQQDERRAEWTTAIAVSRQYTDELCHSLLEARLQCRTVDALPFALARAVGLVTDEDNQRPVAVLDWGFNRATLCMVYAGRPLYVRCLKRAGFSRVLQSLHERFELSHREIQTLLEQHGLPAVSPATTANTAALIDEVLSDELTHFVTEAKKTLEHYQYQRRAEFPSTLYLTGGGGTVRNIAEHLTASLGLEVKLWQLSPEGNNPEASENYPECLFAPAAGLSLLAWEKI